MNLSPDDKLRKDLLDDFLLFCRVMFEARTGREFIISKCISNEPHAVTITNKLKEVFELKIPRLIMNCPPGWHKSEFCKMFIAWCFSHYPDCRFLYISNSYELAAYHTHSIKQLMDMPIYRHLFGIEIRRDSSAKDFFQTTCGGIVAAFGSQSAITGYDAGFAGTDRFTGCIVIDDIHKPDEIHSEVITAKVIRNYFETIERRTRSPNVPIIMIGQILGDNDIFNQITTGIDSNVWDVLHIESLDKHDNARYPEVNSREQLIAMREKQPYVFYTQYQQKSVPRGGALFKEDWFVLLDEHPDIIGTFITCDSAETDKEYNDATVFSFWGLYKIKYDTVEVDLYGLHLIDCIEIRVEPKDLESEFFDFWARCMRFKYKPKFVAIEKKSTGVTLCSVLNKIQGLKVIDIIRSGRVSGRLNSKSNRYIELQQYVASKQISLTRFAKHTKMFIDHMTKITANNTHRFDDICDTVYDAVKFALIDKVFIQKEVVSVDYTSMANELNRFSNKVNRLKRDAYRN